MSTVINNIFWLLAISAAYFILFAFIPFWLKGYRLSGKDVLDKLVKSYLCSHVVIILAVLLLSLAGIYSRLTLTLFLIIIAVGYRFLFKRRQTVDALKSLEQNVYYFTEGCYPIRVIVKSLLGKIKFFFVNLISNIKNPIGVLFTFVIFGFAAYYRCYHAINQMPFVASTTIDVYTHTEWIKYLMNNQPFYNGIYPFGYHAVIAAIASVFGINVVTVIRMFGSISGMMIVFSLYYILRRTMKSTFAINVALALYIITNLFNYQGTWRQFMALPQEYASIFLYFAVYFLYKYMKDKETKDLISFSAAVSLTISIHFYVVIFAGLFCAIAFIFFLVYLNKKTFLRIVIGILCAVCLSVFPFAVGLLKGIEFEDSMGWAVSYFSGDSSATTESEADVALDIYDTLKVYTDTSDDESWLNLNWLLPYLAASAVALFIPIIIFKKRKRFLIFSVFSLYSLALLMLYILAILKIFVLTEDLRLYMFFIYSIPLVICMPFELIYEMLHVKKRAPKIVYHGLIATLTVAGAYFMVVYNRFMPLAKVYKTQYDGAVLAYYDVVNNYPKNKWTIVSPVYEYSLCLFEGYHYELTEFIIGMEDFDENMEIILPTENVFIFIEKRPIKWFEWQQTFPELDEEDVYVDLGERYQALPKWQLSKLYEDDSTNRALHAKANAWALEYKKYFPEEMTVFYEDDEIIVYHIEQNPYALNNLAIQYPGNQTVLNETEK